MNTLKHNKKRNIGLIYEFLVRTISNSIVEGDEKKSSTALEVIKRHFGPGTEIHDEFRLINSLVKTTVSNSSLASSILSEAKSVARSRDTKKLEQEKTKLCLTIEKRLHDSDFYDRHIEDYKAYATAQTLINEWRKPVGQKNVGSMANYEDEMCKWLVAEKKNSAPVIPEAESPGADRLVMKIMTKKLNEKYGDSLTASQKQLIKSYVFANKKEDSSIIKARLASIKEALSNSAKNYLTGNVRNDYVNTKLRSILEMVQAENIDNIDDATLTRFMLYTKLNDELASNE
jgi:hypothetical protein